MIVNSEKSRKTTLFWVFFVVIGGMAVLLWASIFLTKDIERMRSFDFSVIPPQDFSQGFEAVKNTGDGFGQTLKLLQDSVGQLSDLKNAGGALSEEEQIKLDEWAAEKEAQGEEITIEATLEFIEEMRTSE